ncbi:MAG: hypothetical protein M5T61_04195 [Acidimicrobiia bacterium]|nr:hypothetical protein [Acidimicrobiia bacterium]
MTSGELAAGSALGALALIATLVAATAAVGVLSLGVIGHDWINTTQALELLLAYVASIIYMGTFYCLGAILTARSRIATNGLMFALGIWLLVVLVLPQIGDTLDADNQVPGGLFSALTLDKPQEELVMSHFGTYESVRTNIETASLAKHYERFAFAMSDVKAKYRGFTLGHLLGVTHSDILWMLLYPIILGIALVRTFRRQPAIPQGANP